MCLEADLRRRGSWLERELRLGEKSFRSRTEFDQTSNDDLGDWWRSHLSGADPVCLNAGGTDIRTVELFSGIGGLATGFRRACQELGLSLRPVAAIDHDPHAVRVYERNHHPEVVQSGSVSEIVDYRVKGVGSDARFRYEPELVESSWSALEDVDVVLAGPPCQGHSGLNNSSRRSDPRNELYLTVPAIAVALGARAVVIENVPDIVHDRRGVVESARRLLVESGYHVEMGVLRADQMGWAQRRSRFFLVASRDRVPLPLPQVAGALESEPRSVMWAIGDLEDHPADDHMHRQPVFSEENRRRIDWLFENDSYELPLGERPECHQDGTTYNSVYGRMRPDAPAPTITTGFMTTGRGRFTHPTRRRVLNPHEAARLQGFPDTYAFQADGLETPTTQQIVKWLGDAVPMPLGYAAGLSVMAPSA